MVQLWDICNKSLSICEKKVDQAEVFVINARMINLYVGGGTRDIITDNRWIGIGIKTVIDKHVGYVSGIFKDYDEVEKMVDLGVKISRRPPKDEKFESLPEPKKVTGHVDRVYDRNIEELEPQEIKRYAEGIFISSEKDGVKVMSGLIRFNIFEFHIMNSLGVDFHHKGTNIFVHFTAKKRMGEGIIKKYATMIEDIDWEKAGIELYEKTIEASSTKPFKGMLNIETIIEPMELAGMLTAILGATNGENINKKRSPWIGKIGEKVASESLSIIDDGRMSGGLRSALADDEGVPTTRKPIIEKGILRSYYYDYYNSRIANTEPTGNGFRRGIRTQENTHRHPASTAVSNIEILPGKKTLDEIIEDTEKGIIIRKVAAPYVDFITGNFALEIRNATLIENGKKTQPIKHALLIGNIYEAIRNIEQIAKQQEKIGIITLPAIKFKNLQIVGL